MKRETGWFPNGYSAGIAANSGAAGASSEAKASGNLLSSKAPGWETAKSVAEASWKEVTGQQGYTSSFREAGEAASSHLTPDSVAGVIAVAQAKPAGVAAGAVAVGSVASPFRATIRTAAHSCTSSRGTITYTSGGCSAPPKHIREENGGRTWFPGLAQCEAWSFLRFLM